MNIKNIVAENVVEFLNNWADISTDPKAKSACYKSAERIIEAQYIDLRETIAAMVETICNSNEITNHSADAILNLQHYTDTHALPHHLNYKNGIPVLTYLFPLQYNLVQEGDTFHYEIVRGLRY